MNRHDYQQLGDYIREVNVRNRDLAVTAPMGININKYFMPSVANIVGTDLSKYKIVSRRQFACNLMHVGRDEKIPIAILQHDVAIIVSPAYLVFEIIDDSELIPEYLMMWFRRSEFDRNAWFYTDADVRGGLFKQALFDMTLPVPSIERQRAMVAEYETLSRRIDLNRSMIAQLEATAQTLYRKMFVDGIDPEHLPSGWRMGTIGDFCKEMTSGGTPSRRCREYWNSKDYRWLKTGEIQNNVILDTEEYISECGLRNSAAKLIPQGTVTMAMYGATASLVAYLDCETTTNQACCNMVCFDKGDASYLYFHLRYHQEEIKRFANGGAQENLNQEIIAQQPIFILEDRACFQPFVDILNQMIVKTKENKILTELQSLLLAKMGQ